MSITKENVSSFMPTAGMEFQEFGQITMSGDDLTFEGFSISGDGYYCAEETLIRLCIKRLADELEKFRSEVRAERAK